MYVFCPFNFNIAVSRSITLNLALQECPGSTYMRLNPACSYLYLFLLYFYNELATSHAKSINLLRAIILQTPHVAPIPGFHLLHSSCKLP